MDELSISERLERSVHLFALGNPSSSLAGNSKAFLEVDFAVSIAVCPVSRG